MDIPQLVFKENPVDKTTKQQIKQKQKNISCKSKLKALKEKLSDSKKFYIKRSVKQSSQVALSDAKLSN